MAKSFVVLILRYNGKVQFSMVKTPKVYIFLDTVIAACLKTKVLLFFKLLSSNRKLLFCGRSWGSLFILWAYNKLNGKTNRP
jgi:hypothetical protein